MKRQNYLKETFKTMTIIQALKSMTFKSFLLLFFFSIIYKNVSLICVSYHILNLLILFHFFLLTVSAI